MMNFLARPQMSIITRLDCTLRNKRLISMYTTVNSTFLPGKWASQSSVSTSCSGVENPVRMLPVHTSRGRRFRCLELENPHGVWRPLAGGGYSAGGDTYTDILLTFSGRRRKKIRLEKNRLWFISERFISEWGNYWLMLGKQNVG